jgi:hypothetical protein
MFTLFNALHALALALSNIAHHMPYGRCAVWLWEQGGALECWCDEHRN